MRTTEQMLDQGELALEKYGAVDSRMSLEILLDCVLADVPDPYEATSALVNADRRIRELEARQLTGDDLRLLSALQEEARSAAEEGDCFVVAAAYAPMLAKVLGKLAGKEGT